MRRYTAARGDFDFTNATLSPHLMPAEAMATGTFSFFIDVVLRTAPASEHTFLHWDNVGADGSFLSLGFNASRQIVARSGNAAAATTNGTSVAAYALNTLLRIYVRRITTGTIQVFVNQSAAADIALVAADDFDTALTRMTLGRAIGGTTSLSFDVGGFNVFAVVDNTDRAELMTDLTSPLRIYTTATTPAMVANPVGSVSFKSSLAGTHGTVDLSTGRKPVWIDDSAFYTGESAPIWAAPAIDSCPAIRNGERIPANGNFDLISIGDSFGAMSDDRFPLQYANEFLKLGGASVRKALLGVRTNGDIHSSTINTTTAGDYQLVNGSDNELETAGGGPGSIFMGCPLEYHNTGGLRELYTSGPPAGITFGKMNFKNGLADGPFSTWIGTSTQLDAIPIVIYPTATQLDELSLTDNGTNPQTVAFDGSESSTYTRWSNSLIPLVNNGTAGQRFMELNPVGGAMPLNRRLIWAGGLARVNGRSTGLGIMSISGDSWSYSNFGIDEAATTSTDKDMSVAQLLGIFSAYGEFDRKIVVQTNLADEGASQATYTTAMQDIIDACDDILTGQGASLNNISYQFVTPVMHGAAGSMTTARRNAIEASALAADALAQADERVSTLSCYLLTDGCFFHDGGEAATIGPNDANGPQAAWLAEYDGDHGTDFATTPGVVWLDTSDLHLADADAAFAQAYVAAQQSFAEAGGGGTALGAGNDSAFGCAYDAAFDMCPLPLLT